MLSSTTAGELVVSWEAPSSAPDGYRVIWAKSTGSFKSWSSADGNAYPLASPYTITGLEAGVSYKVNVRATYSGQSAGPWAGIVEAVVAEDSGQPPPAVEQDPKAISGLVLSSTTPGELVVSWDAPTSEPDDYRVMWAESTGSWPSWSSADGNAYPTAGPYTITGLEAGVSYKVNVRARYSGQSPGPWAGRVDLEVASSQGSEDDQDGRADDELGIRFIGTEKDPGTEADNDLRFDFQGGNNPVDVPSDTTTTAEVLINGIFNDGTVEDPNPGGRYEGSIDFGGDTDFVRVWLLDGVRYQIDMLAKDNPWGTGHLLTLDYADMRGLHGPDGNLIAATRPHPAKSWYQYGAVSRIIHTPAEEGWHYIAAQSGSRTRTGTYQIQVFDLDHLNANTTPAGIPSKSEPPGQDFVG